MVITAQALLHPAPWNCSQDWPCTVLEIGSREGNGPPSPGKCLGHGVMDSTGTTGLCESGGRYRPPGTPEAKQSAMALWHAVTDITPQGSLGIGIIPPTRISLPPDLCSSPAMTLLCLGLWPSFQNPPEDWIYIPSKERGHQIKDPWALGWQQKERKGNH